MNHRPLRPERSALNQAELHPDGAATVRPRSVVNASVAVHASEGPASTGFSSCGGSPSDVSSSCASQSCAFASSARTALPHSLLFLLAFPAPSGEPAGQVAVVECRFLDLDVLQESILHLPARFKYQSAVPFTNQLDSRSFPIHLAIPPWVVQCVGERRRFYGGDAECQQVFSGFFRHVCPRAPAASAGPAEFAPGKSRRWCGGRNVAAAHS